MFSDELVFAILGVLIGTYVGLFVMLLLKPRKRS